MGASGQRLAATLLPTWRYAALTEPVGERLTNAITFQGSVADTDDIDHFRVVDGDRLLWSSPETTWQANPHRFAKSIQRRIAAVFPKLGPVKIAESWSGVFGQTVHGMPQIGQLRQGLWVLSGFGRQGLNTTAMGGQLVARSILSGDDRWRLFAPFELVWAGGTAGRIAGQAAESGRVGTRRLPALCRGIASAPARGSKCANVRGKSAWPRRRREPLPIGNVLPPQCSVSGIEAAPLDLEAIIPEWRG